MDLMLVLGLALVGGTLVFGIPNFLEGYKAYIHVESIFLVLGGTLAATMISTSIRRFRAIVNVFMYLTILPKKKLLPDRAVAIMVDLGEKAHESGKHAIIESGIRVGDGYLDRALNLLGTGLDKEFIQKTLEVEIFKTKRRHELLINMVRTMGSYAPLFGMIGTILGIMEVLRHVTDIDNVVSGMAFALITTLYGLILSSVFFIPFSHKLRMMSDRELLSKEIILEGILMIYDQEIPLKIEKYLSSYLETRFRS